MSFPWNDDSHATLRRMWSAGVSASKIAKHLGQGATRNAVVGKAHRLGLERRNSPIRPLPAGQIPKRFQRANRGQAKGVRLSIMAATVVPFVRKEVAPVALHPTHKCRWITTDDRPWIFCDSACRDGSSYCPDHHARAYQPRIMAAE
jgi:hypothetical protein